MARKVRINGWTTVVGFVVAMLACAVPAGADIFYVDQDSTALEQDGSSWCKAYDDLQDALTAAGNTPGEHVIRVAEGTYKPHTSDRTVSFVMKDDVDIEGAYAGIGGCVDPDAQDFDTYVTTLSGDIGTVGVHSDNSYHVITCGSGVTARLEGLTITRGNANGSTDDHRSGGGIRNGYYVFDTGARVEGGTLQLDDCTFSSNDAANGGGGMSNLAKPAALTRCTFTDNDADGSTGQWGGGAFYNREGDSADDTNSTFTDCTFEMNEASDGGAVWSGDEVTVSFVRCLFDQNTGNNVGGAIRLAAEAGATIDDCDFTSNTALTGGALYGGGVSGRTVDVEDSTFTSNSATGTGAAGSGGALWILPHTSLLRCTFDSNTAEVNGGAVHVTKLSAGATVLDYAACTFDTNTAEKSGGAVYEGNDGLAITYVNSLFVFNEAKGTGTDEGGGAVFNGGSTDVSYVNCTFVDNMATGGEGGGIRVANGTDPVVTNGIFWDNCDGSTCATEDESAQIHLGGTGGDDAGVTNSTIEGCAQPGFCDASTNKAVEPTFRGTGQPNPYALKDDAANDPLIDDGDGAESTHGTCPSVNDTSLDLAGNTRFVRDDGVCVSSNANFVDMGAYEVQ